MARRILPVLLVVGCTRTAPSAPAPTVTPEPEEADDALPMLPADLEASLGDARERVARLHEAPKPSLDEPFATKAEHEQWVARELDPWHDRTVDGVLRPVQGAMPKLDPAARVDDAGWLAHQRARFVHGVLTTDVFLESMLVQFRVPLPTEAAPQVELGLARAHELVALQRESCTTFDGGEQPIPEDLRSWASYCTDKIAIVVAELCSAEKRVGLAASVPCGGERPIGEPKESPPPHTPMSMQEMTQIANQALDMCELAEDMLEESGTPTVAQWRAALDEQGVDNPRLVAVIDAALAEGSAEALTAKMRELMMNPAWECGAVKSLIWGR